jgi:hypothetical protein
VAFKAGVVRVREAGPLSPWAHWRCFAEPSLLPLCRRAALDAARLSGPAARAKLEPLLLNAADATAAPVASSDSGYPAAAAPLVRLQLRCDLLGASAAASEGVRTALGDRGPLGRTRQRQRAAVAGSLDAALAGSADRRWLEIERSGTLWDDDGHAGTIVETVSADDSRHEEEGEQLRSAAVRAEPRPGSSSRRNNHAARLAATHGVHRAGIRSAEKSSSEEEDDLRQEPTSASASEDDDNHGSSDEAQPVVPLFVHSGDFGEAGAASFMAIDRG